jgi:hypothetical protein
MAAVAAGDFFQPGHHAQQRGFAAARGADDDDEFAVADFCVHAMDDLVGLGAVAIALDDVAREMDAINL